MALCIVASASCGVSAGGDAEGDGAEAGGAAASATAPPGAGRTTPTFAEPAGGAEVLRSAREAIALVMTPMATGTAVVLDDGHLLTNAHVIDPYDAADLRFEDGELLEDVPVVGVDLLADIAVLGPVDIDRPSLAVGDLDATAQGDDVYLVGFPGQQVDQEAVVSRGVRSRDRRSEHFDLGYLLSDATIAGGQSGGPLLDAQGRWLGVATYEDEDGYAWSLQIDQALDAVERILAGDGTADWRPRPQRELAGEHELAIGPEREIATFYVPAQEAAAGPAGRGRAVDVEIQVDGGAPALVVADTGNETFPFAANEAALAADDAPWILDDAEPLDEVGPGAWTFRLEPGFDAVFSVSGATEAEVTVRTSVAVERFSLLRAHGELEVGETRRLALDHGQEAIVLWVDLERGQEVEIAARTVAGDAAWRLWAQDDFDGDSLADADDGGGGLWDLDAVGRFRPDESGSFDLNVYDYGLGSRVVEVSVTEV
jgi:S1-C subfamily serine protease